MITVAFITCVNNQAQYEQCLAHLGRLDKQGFSVEYIPMHNCVSITGAYNRAMTATGAKYKVYIHQDAYILEPMFLHHINNIFMSDPSIGMIGVLGGRHLPLNPHLLTWLWDCPEIYGNVYVPRVNGTMGGRPTARPYEWVTVVDGCLMATQYDIPWRQDLIDGFHFYDLSQSLEFWKKNLKVVVPTQVTPWVSHICNQQFDPEFFRLRQKFIGEYGQYLSKKVKRTDTARTIAHKGKKYRFTK